VQHQLGQLVQTLLAWRQGVNDEIKKAYSSGGGTGAAGGGSGGGGGGLSLQGVCKRAAVEIMFLDAAEVVLQEFQPAFWDDRHFVSFFDTVQQ